MTKKRINIKDVVKEEFYQIPKLFFWDKDYRESSPGSKLLYMLVRDRFSLSLYTTKQENEKAVTPSYVDDNGDIYCILDNQEIEFTLNTTTKTVIKWMNELIDLGLVETEDVEGGANRIYLNTLDSSGASLATFLGQRDYYKHVKARKKKKKEPNKTEQECIDEWIKKLDKGTVPAKKKAKQEGGNNSTGSGGKSTPPSDVKSTYLGEGEIPPPGDEDCPPPVEEKVHPNKNYVIELEGSDLDSNQNYDSELTKSSSSSNQEEYSELEEEQNENPLITVFDNYSFLETYEPFLELCPTSRAINVVRKRLMESKIESFYVSDLNNALGLHSKNVREYEKKGEIVRYAPAFFANNLVDTIIANQAARQLNTNKKKVDPSKVKVVDLPLYDWVNN